MSYRRNVFLLAVLGAVAAAATLVPVAAGASIYTLRLFNADDLVSAYVTNSSFDNALMLSAAFGEDTGFVDVTGFIRPGDNNVLFTDLNAAGGWSYGFDLRKDGVTLDYGMCGVAGVSSCGDDQSVGLVFSQDPKIPNGAVPEPAIWTMMIFGFGLIGAAARRRPSLARP